MNDVKKNLRKSSESGVAAALAVVVAKTLISHNIIPVETESYVIIVIVGVATGLWDFVRHSDWAKNLLKKKKGGD
jgi:hypothetical protein